MHRQAKELFLILKKTECGFVPYFLCFRFLTGSVDVVQENNLGGGDPQKSDAISETFQEILAVNILAIAKTPSPRGFLAWYMKNPECLSSYPELNVPEQVSDNVQASICIYPVRISNH